MGKKNLKIIAKNVLYPLIGMGIFFAVWAIAAAVNNNPLLLESPLVTAAAALKLLGGADFWGRLFNSFLLALSSFLISFSLALTLSLLAIVFDLNKIFSPVVTIVRSVPTVAVIILILLWSDAMVTPVIVSVLVVFPVVYSSFFVTLTGAKKELIEAARVFGAGRVGLVRYVYLPTLRRSMVENTASGLSLSLKIGISAEILVSTARSVGQFMKSADKNMQVANVLAAALMVALLCILIEFSVRLVLRTKAFSY